MSDPVRLPLLRDAVSLALRGVPLPEHWHAPTACYELSGVLPLFDDWERERKREVPRLPPHECLWAEWLSPVPPDWPSASMRAGVWLQRFGFDGTTHPISAAITTELGLSRWYAMAGFGRMAGERAVASVHLATVGLSEDGRRWQVFATRTASPFAAQMPRFDGFGAEVDLYWPALMAFGLLNCANIDAQEHCVPKDIRRRRAREGKEPLCSYRTLRIVAPATIRSGPYRPAEAGEPVVRRHLCRGHFHSFRAARFKAARGTTIWYPEHWRGDDALGSVEGPREVVAD